MVYLITTEIPYRKTFLKSREWTIGSHCSTSFNTSTTNVWIKVSNFILQRSDVSWNRIAKISNIIAPRSFQLKTFIYYITSIHRSSRISCLIRNNNVRYNQIFRFLLIPIHTQRKAVLESAKVKTNIQLLRSFPLQIRIIKLGRLSRCHIIYFTIAERIPSCIRNQGIRIFIPTQITCTTILSPTAPHFQKCNRSVIVLCKKVFIGYSPSHRSRRKVSPAIRRRQYRSISSVSTHGKLSHVAVLIVITHTTKVRQFAVNIIMSTGTFYRIAGRPVHIRIQKVIFGYLVYTSRHINLVRLRIRHTQHGRDIMCIQQGGIIVDKVLPLVISSR